VGLISPNQVSKKAPRALLELGQVTFQVQKNECFMVFKVCTVTSKIFANPQ
jgi:hypothetical protein